MLLEVRHLMRTVAMKIKEKQRLIVRNPVSKSNGQWSEFLDLKFLKYGRGWHWPSDKFLGGSLNASGDGIRRSAELSEWAIQQETGRLPIHVCCGKKKLGGRGESLCEFVQLQLAELHEKGGLNSQRFQVRREKNWKC